MPSCADGMSLLDKGDAALQSSGSVTGSLTQIFSQKGLSCPAGHTGIKDYWRASGIHPQTQLVSDCGCTFGHISHFSLTSYGLPLLSSSY